MEQTIVQVKKMSNTAKIPLLTTQFSAGVDMYANIPKVTMIRPHETVKVPTGIAMSIPKGYFGALVARSGIATKRNLAPINCVGIIDSDYRGEILVPLHNHGNETQIIEPDERIAQLIIMPYLPIVFEEVDSLDSTKRGEGGFGSTGV